LPLVPSRHRLQQLAHRQATGLGHHLTDWVPEGKNASVADCEACGLYAVVDSSPLKYEPTIYGSTVSVPCKGHGTTPVWSTAHDDTEAAA
jgi:hypothetical protein